MIVFALPANEFPAKFFLNWLKFTGFLQANKINYTVSIQSGSNVSIVRELCLGLSMEDVIDLSKKVPPFYNEIDYSHIMWIDSDIIFQPEDIMKLLSHDLDIVSGLYHLTPDTYSVVKLGQENFSHDSELVSKDLIEAKSVGTGFLLVKKGVFEKIERPWFQTGEIEEDGKKKFLGEDIYFCLKARKAGFKIFADPTIRVNHLKLGYL